MVLRFFKKLSAVLMMCVAGLFLGAMIQGVTDATAATKAPEKIATHQNWQAYKLKEGDNMVCFMISKPTKSTGKVDARGEVFALITHRPAENTKDLVSIMSGYTYKKESEVKVDVGKNDFSLFTEGDTAWTPSDKVDHDLTASIRKGSTMKVTGTSKDGVKTVDTFSLSGSGDAYRAISKACGVK